MSSNRPFRHNIRNFTNGGSDDGRLSIGTSLRYTTSRQFFIPLKKLSGTSATESDELLQLNSKKNVSTPVLIDQQYRPYGQCKSQIPSCVKITNVSFKDIRGPLATQVAVKLVCSRGIPCWNVQMSGINLELAGTSQCVNVKPTVSGKNFPPACAAPAPKSSTS
ncbi:exopolygalacturonase clone GBGA483-like [Actinidia eriantha]|uniref:exopolygalacturonase clone GBGA483-like n=1 Tax=Actinidia eriantha TaxID=165200 RepID=UPI00258D14EA|nr:exopolygalacturonase clone GBGA483-like [Actinidia eriantha]